MRNTASMSPSSEDLSVLSSSADALSLSTLSLTTSSPRSLTSRTRASVSSQSEGYEMLAQLNRSHRSSVSLHSASTASFPPPTAFGDAGQSSASDKSAPSKSAARRARQRDRVAASKSIKEENDEQVKLVDLVSEIPYPQKPTASRPAVHVSSSESDEGVKGKGKKTRRSGKTMRLRLEKAAVREVLSMDELESSLPSASSITSHDDELSEDGASRFLDDDEDDEDVVEGMSALEGHIQTVPHSSSGSLNVQMRSLRVEGSVLSSDDAKSAIDSFVAGSAVFLSDKANKLRLWQAICIELGLVQLEEEDDLPDLPRSAISPLRVSKYETPPSSRASTPRPTRPPLPQSLKQARALLKAKGHVNVADYLDARNTAGYDLASLVFPSMSAMVRYTKKNGKFVRLDTVKGLWLEPLLRDFRMKYGKMVQ
ncbi:MAG: hypothetical protein TREMPRED_000395 [Tremellales sp. Tagirdzhanova-0007]|nr:MAG: hypothetical protein TREMPRED_000395 [Tremellales sp. Tagirdzhanova-0007]